MITLFELFSFSKHTFCAVFLLQSNALNHAKVHLIPCHYLLLVTFFMNWSPSC